MDTKTGELTAMTSGGRPAPRTLPEAMVRTLRHEVGDLLQTLYATVAILQKRLPADWILERRILTDMRARGEGCKLLLDSVHDFVCPMSLKPEPVDLAEVGANLVRMAATRFPKLRIDAVVETRDVLQGDSRRLGQVGEALLQNACEGAQHQVRFLTRRSSAGDQIEWVVTDDGPAVPAEQLANLYVPFFITRHGRPGLGLALAKRIVDLHGGDMQAENVPGGGFQLCVALPTKPVVQAEALAS